MASFDLEHWAKHAERIVEELEDYPNAAYVEFAFDLARTLGWSKFFELTKALENFTGTGLARPAYFDDEGRCWSSYKWGSHADEDHVVHIYGLLGWEQSVLLLNWRHREWDLFDAHDGTLPPREHWCLDKACLVHEPIKAESDVVELPHGLWCPDVTPTVTAEAVRLSVTSPRRSCTICNATFEQRRTDAGYCSNACRQKAYRTRKVGAA